MNRINFFRQSLAILASSVCLGAYAQRPVPAAYNNSQVSYIKTFDATAPESNPDLLISRPLMDVKQAQNYLDGLGRPLQTVIKQGSLQTGASATDFVSPVEYDAWGRETVKYLSFPGSSNNGSFNTAPFIEQANFMGGHYSSQGEYHYYSETVLDGSSLNRMVKSFSQGSSWVGGNKFIESKYLNNDETDDDVKKISVTDANPFGIYAVTGTYEDGKLTKTVTIDEDLKQVVEYKDSDGKVILKKVQIADNPSLSYNGWMCTYYIYDTRGNLRCVVQPEGVAALQQNGWVFTNTILDEQSFRYEYDHRKRVVRKKVPGAGEVYMVYDIRDRLVLTQDANMRTGQPRWLYSTYDNENRPVATGFLLNDYTTHASHITGAASSSSYPNLNYYTTEELTHNFYDNYTWLSTYNNPLPGNYTNDYDVHFLAISNLNFPYPQANQPFYLLKGVSTGSRVKVLGTSTYLYSVSFYDENGRVIQVQSTNITGGIDIVTTQYSWTGQPLITIQKIHKADAYAEISVVVTKTNYDALGRVITVEKKLSNSMVNGGQMSNYKVIVSNEYDKLGQLKKKSLGTNALGGGPLETLEYDYNIRGWILGMNRSYAKDANSNNYFGFDLGYDKAANGIIGNQSYAHPQFNGNISGTVWKSKGDGEKRKYDFSYDAANRIMKADFTQYNGSGFDQSAGINFNMKMGDGTTVPSAYDLNGNIRQMQHWGLKFGQSTQVDNLGYLYQTGSNKLVRVTDQNNDPNTLLGDFKDGLNSGDDYTFDNNGNLILDNNKSISSISYDHLNLPQVITVTGKGTISFTYDAGGNKLKKTVAETGQPVKTTLYLGGVYENDILQFIPHEEGRIRFAPATIATCPAQPDRFFLDYYIKDHLGNVRMLLTEQHELFCYSPATVEDASWQDESLIYNIIDERREKLANINGADQYASQLGEYFYRTQGAVPAEKTGLEMVLKVMAGDEVKIVTESYYNMPVGGPGNPTGPPVLTDLLSALAGSSAFSNTHGGMTGGQIAGLANNTNLLNGFLSGLTPPSNTAKAFVCWILFDEQLRYLSGGAEAVNQGGGYKIHSAFVNNPIIASKSGYLYIYVINESDMEVFFDNLAVTHIPGPIVEETHYYPFGIKMYGISSKLSGYGAPINTEKTFQSQLTDIDFGLNWIQFKWRNHDPQIGRFIEIDPLSEKYVYNSTYAFSENKVTSHIELEGLESLSAGKPEGYLMEGFRQWFQAIGSVFTVKAEVHINKEVEVKTEIKTPSGKIEQSTTTTVIENKAEFKTNFGDYFKNGGGKMIEFNAESNAFPKVETKTSATINTSGAPIVLTSEKTLDAEGMSTTTTAGTGANLDFKNLGASVSAAAFRKEQLTGANSGQVTYGFRAAADATFVNRRYVTFNSKNVKVTTTNQTNVGGSIEVQIKH